jgi:hypothetical protein
MTGPEHYREAERLLTEQEFAFPSGRETRTFEETMAAAQVHATLAAAAAAALAALGASGAEGRAWRDITGTKFTTDGS